MSHDIKCEYCGKEVRPDTTWNSWLRLYHFVDFLALQGSITPEMQGSIVDDLLNFKGYAEDVSVKEEEERKREIEEMSKED